MWFGVNLLQTLTWPGVIIEYYVMHLERWKRSEVRHNLSQRRSRHCLRVLLATEGRVRHAICGVMSGARLSQSRSLRR